jgi:membrane associated rhomboid family serine protease
MFIGWLLRGVFPNITSAITAHFCLAADPSQLLSAPWTLFTYMFTHVNFLHLLINMLWLIGFGPMIKGDWRHTVVAYILGGLLGGVLFICYSLITGEVNRELTGASAAVIAIVVLSACLSPDRKLQMLLIGEIKLKWLALLAIITLFAVSPFSAETAAHLGGVIAGIIIGAVCLIRYKTISYRALELARRETHRKSILHKAEQSGFTSLSEAERIELFDLHKTNH